MEIEIILGTMKDNLTSLAHNELTKDNGLSLRIYYASKLTITSQQKKIHILSSEYIVEPDSKLLQKFKKVSMEGQGCATDKRNIRPNGTKRKR